MTFVIKPMPKPAAKILHALVSGLADPGDSRKLDNAPDVFMAVHVELIAVNAHGTVYSIAHYFKQNGDLVADPEMELLHVEGRGWYPLSIMMQFGRNECIELVDGWEHKVSRYRLGEQMEFLFLWMENIRQQQGL
jgi:hypothetical protein